MKAQTFSAQYKQNASSLHHFKLEGSQLVQWESPSNIALIKYWGKHGDQLPQNPSLSFTLKNSKTITSVVYKKAKNTKPEIEYFFENQQKKDFENRIKRYLNNISVYLPFLESLDLKISSHNTFPHSVGIASSASSFSALALCLCNIEKNLFQTLYNEDDFHKKASFLARHGSGSACRSVFGKTVLWGKTGLVEGSSDEISIPLDYRVHDIFEAYHDAILIIDSDKKSLSSTSGHALMQGHPFAKARYLQARKNLGKMLDALKKGNEKKFARITENEAFTLHALMISSSPPVHLIKPNTLAVISNLVKFREKHNLNFTFTLDAGPNIHILYPKRIKGLLVNFIENELLMYCENEKWIDDEISIGPKTHNLLNDEI